jgi:hypothetical protein
MNMHVEEKQAKTPRWVLSALALVLGIGSLWFTWLRYESLSSQPDFYWYNWIQIAGIALLGVLCLWASVLFLWGKSHGWSVFKAGLSIVPLVLFFNLMILLYRVVQNILQGNASFFFERVLSQPYKVILVVVILVALTLLRSLQENKGEQ